MHHRNSRCRIPYAEAHDDFLTYFSAGDGAVALHSCLPSDGGSAPVWDARRLSRLHDSMLDPRMLDEDRNIQRVRPLLMAFAQAHPAEWMVGFMVFRPRGWPEDLAKLLSRGRDGGSLVGLAITGEPLRREYVRLHTGQRIVKCSALLKAKAYEQCLDLAVAPIDPTPMDLLEFARRQAEPRLDDTGQKQALFEPLRRDGEKRLEVSLATYQRFLLDMHRDAVAPPTRMAS